MSMERRLNFNIMPSLQHRGLVKVAVSLWNQTDMRDSDDWFQGNLMNEQKRIVNELLKKVEKLPLPDSLQKELSRCVEGVGYQITIWKQFNDKHCNFRLNPPSNVFSWTPQGTIDKKKTAELLVRDESLNIYDRYRIACTYCLEDDIRFLWNRLEKYDKDPERLIRERSIFVSFWSLYILGKLAKFAAVMLRHGSFDDRHRTPLEFAFRRSAQDGNETASRYLLRKLPPNEKERILVSTAEDMLKYRYQCISEVILFLLSQMAEDEQTKLFKRYPHEVLKSFLNWPRQCLFMDMANDMWDYLCGKYFYDVLRWGLIFGIEKCKVHYDYQIILREFWLRSPKPLKTYFIDKLCNDRCIIMGLFKIGDVESIKLFLKSATLVEKEKIIFSQDVGYMFSKFLVSDEKWDLIQYFISECISTKNGMLKFKELIKEVLKGHFSAAFFEVNKEKFNKTFKIIDDFACKYDKRKSVEEQGSSPAQKRRHLKKKLVV